MCRTAELKALFSLFFPPFFLFLFFSFFPPSFSFLQGAALRLILDELTAAGYTVFHRIVNARPFVPQVLS
jgi:hypothetical protein